MAASEDLLHLAERKQSKQTRRQWHATDNRRVWTATDAGKQKSEIYQHSLIMVHCRCWATLVTHGHLTDKGAMMLPVLGMQQFTKPAV